MTDPSSNVAGWLWDHVMTYFTPLATAIAGSAVTHWFGRRKSKAEHDRDVAERQEQESLEFEKSLVNIADSSIRSSMEWLQRELGACRDELRLCRKELKLLGDYNLVLRLAMVRAGLEVPKISEPAS